jgi:hypothetical protein
MVSPFKNYALINSDYSILFSREFVNLIWSFFGQKRRKMLQLSVYKAREQGLGNREQELGIRERGAEKE